jgi:hypothetical protein
MKAEGRDPVPAFRFAPGGNPSPQCGVRGTPKEALSKRAQGVPVISEVNCSNPKWGHRTGCLQMAQEHFVLEREALCFCQLPLRSLSGPVHDLGRIRRFWPGNTSGDPVSDVTFCPGNGGPAETSQISQLPSPRQFSSLGAPSLVIRCRLYCSQAIHGDFSPKIVPACQASAPDACTCGLSSFLPFKMAGS